jgi:hypothetical protein
LGSHAMSLLSKIFMLCYNREQSNQLSATRTRQNYVYRHCTHS